MRTASDKVVRNAIIIGFTINIIAIVAFAGFIALHPINPGKDTTALAPYDAKDYPATPQALTLDSYCHLDDGNRYSINLWIGYTITDPKGLHKSAGPDYIANLILPNLLQEANMTMNVMDSIGIGSPLGVEPYQDTMKKNLNRILEPKGITVTDVSIRAERKN